MDGGQLLICKWCGKESGISTHPDWTVCKPYYIFLTNSSKEYNKWFKEWKNLWGNLSGYFVDDYLRGNWPRKAPGSEELDPNY